MTSKISFFKLMKEDLRSRLWMAALSSFGSLMTLPVLFLFSSAYTSRFATSPPVPDYTNALLMNYFQKHCINFHGTIVILGAIIVAVFGFRYLFSKKMVDMYHSTPVKRSRLFLVFYLDGVLIWLIPYLAAMMLTLVMACIYLPVPSFWPGFFLAAGKLTLHFLFLFLIVYHVSLVAVMISGNLLNTFINLLLLGMGAAGVFALIGQLFIHFMDTFIQLPMKLPHILWLSPLAAAVYSQLEKLPFFRVNSSNVFFLCSCLTIAAVNFFAARKLYMNRPSELAQQGLPNTWFTALLRLLTAYLCGLVPVWFILTVLSNHFSSFIGWCIFAGIIGCILGHGIIQIIYTMNIKNFLAGKKQLGAITLFTVLTILAFYFDWFGYDSRLPSPDDIETAQIDLSGFEDGTQFQPSGEAGTVVSGQNNGSKITLNYTDIQRLDQLLTSIIPKQDTDYIYSVHSGLDVHIKLKNGHHFYRHYKVDADDFAQLKPIVESNEYKQDNYAMYSGGLGLPSRVEIKSADYKTTYHLTSQEEITGLMNAYYSDFNKSYRMENLAECFSLSAIDIMYVAKETQISHYYTLQVPDYYTETLAALNAISPDIVPTETQLEPASIQIDPSISTRSADLEADLYAYFGYEPIPSKLSEDINGLPAAENSTPHGSWVTLTIEDSLQLKEIMSISRAALNYRNTIFSPEYIRAGTLTTTDGTDYDLYVKPGTFPLEYIRMICEQYR